jgi:hypothetical protein
MSSQIDSNYSQIPQIEMPDHFAPGVAGAGAAPTVQSQDGA